MLLLLLLAVNVVVLYASEACPDLLASNSKPQGVPFAKNHNTPILECRALCSGSSRCSGSYVDLSTLTCFLHTQPAQDNPKGNDIDVPRSDVNNGRINLRNTKDFLGFTEDSISDLDSLGNTEKHPTWNRNAIENGEKHGSDFRVSAPARGTLQTADGTRSLPCGPLPGIPNAVTQGGEDGRQGTAVCMNGFRSVFTNSSAVTVKCKQGEWIMDNFVCSINVALHKPSRQSSTRFNLVSGLAVDGRRKTCSRTTLIKKTKSWWMVDLNNTYTINYINIVNSWEDCCWRRLSNFRVYLGRITATGDIQYKLCLTHPGRFKGLKTLSCNHLTRGRYLRIDLLYRKLLSLCEVEVFPLLL